ncbi:MAG: YlbF family regulator [Firmicutes bacterium]|nr:YlbF family regulator [Bacillota bacterium]
MNPHDKAHELARALQASDAYAGMKRARDQIEPDPQAKHMLRDFHLKQLQYEQKRLMGHEPTEEEQQSLQKLYEALQMHHAVREYLLAEYQLGIVMQDVQKILSDSLQDVALTDEFGD